MSDVSPCGPRGWESGDGRSLIVLLGRRQRVLTVVSRRRDRSRWCRRSSEAGADRVGLGTSRPLPARVGAGSLAARGPTQPELPQSAHATTVGHASPRPRNPPARPHRPTVSENRRQPPNVDLQRWKRQTQLEVPLGTSNARSREIDDRHAGRSRATTPRARYCTVCPTFSCPTSTGTCKPTNQRRDPAMNHTPSQLDLAERTAASPPAPAGLLDVNALAQRLGVTPRFVRRLVSERRVPFLKIGKFVRFEPREIDEWMDDARHPSVDAEDGA